MIFYLWLDVGLVELHLSFPETFCHLHEVALEPFIGLLGAMDLEHCVLLGLLVVITDDIEGHLGLLELGFYLGALFIGAVLSLSSRGGLW